MHNKCDEIWGFIFVQTQLKGFQKRKWGKKQGATEHADNVKQQLEDKDALAIVKVKVFTDLSKEETNETFRRIKEESARYVAQNNCGLGLVFSTIGFWIET